MNRETMYAHGAKSKGTDTWLSPLWVTASLPSIFPTQYGDPCPGPIKNHTGASWQCDYPSESGLSVDWMTNNFVNPPFSDMESWVNKAIIERNKNRNSLWFTKIDFRTHWGTKMAENAASIYMVKGYVRFLEVYDHEWLPQIIEGNSATFQTGFVLFTHDQEWKTTVEANLIEVLGHRLVIPQS